MKSIKRTLFFLIMAVLVLCLTGCFTITGANGIKASGGGYLASAVDIDQKAVLGFNVQITSEPTVVAGETEFIEAKGRLQYHDMGCGFMLHAEITGVVYCADDGGFWPDKTIYFYGFADPDKMKENDDWTVVIIAQSLGDGTNRLQISVTDFEGNIVYENIGDLTAGNIKIKTG